MSSNQPPPEEPFPKKPEGEGSGTGSPYDRMPPPPPPPSHEAPYGEPQADPLAGMPPLASRLRRLAARIIDALLVGIPVGAVLALAFGGYDYNDQGRIFSQEIIYTLVYLAYEGTMLSSRGQTFGKKWMKIRVALLENGEIPHGQPGWARAATYSLPTVVPCCGSIFWLVNVLWCTWDKPYHQALHDKVAKTVVVEAV